MPTTNEENKTVIRRVLEAMNSRQLDGLDDLIATDVVRHWPATPSSDVRSLKQLKELLPQDAEVFPDNTQTITHLVAEGDLVAVWATYEVSQKGPIGPFPLRG